MMLGDKVSLLLNGGVDYSAPPSLLSNNKSPYCVNWIYKDNKLVRRGGVNTSIFGGWTDIAGSPIPPLAQYPISGGETGTPKEKNTTDSGTASIKKLYEYIDGHENSHTIAITNSGAYEYRKIANTVWGQKTSGTSTYLSDVSVLDDNNALIVGKDGTILHWNGTAWSAQTSGTTNWLNGVFYLDSTHAYAVGASGTILFYNGTSWSTIVSGTSNELQAVWASADDDVWVVGENRILVHYDGTTWTVSTPFPTGDLTHIDGSDTDWIFAGTDTGITYYWNGAAWTNLYASIGMGVGMIKGIIVFSKSSVIVLNSNKKIGFWNGTSWSITSIPDAPATPNAIWGEARNSLYLADAGATGIIYYWNGVDSTWTQVGTVTDYITEIKGDKDSKACAISSNGKIFMKDCFATTDSWTSLGSLSGSDSHNIDCCTFGGYLYITNGVDNLKVWRGYGELETVYNNENYYFQSPPDSPKFVESFSEHLFLGKSVSNGVTYNQRISWSSVASPDKWSGGSSGYEDLYDDPYPITGMATAGDVLLIFKPYKIYMGKYNGSSFAFLPTSSQIGTKAPNSIAKMKNGVVFVGNDNIYYIDSITLKPVGTAIFKKLAEEIDSEEWNSIVGTVLEDESQYWILYKPTGVTNYTAGFIWNFKEDKWSEVSFSLPGSIGITTIGSVGVPIEGAMWVNNDDTWEEATYAWDSNTEYAQTKVLAIGADNGIIYTISDDSHLDITSPFESIIKTSVMRLPVLSQVNRITLYGSGGTIQCRMAVGRSEKDTYLYYPLQYTKMYLDGRAVFSMRNTGDWIQIEIMTNGENDDIELVGLDIDIVPRTGTKRSRR